MKYIILFYININNNIFYIYKKVLSFENFFLKILYMEYYIYFFYNMKSIIKSFI